MANNPHHNPFSQGPLAGPGQGRFPPPTSTPIQPFQPGPPSGPLVGGQPPIGGPAVSQFGPTHLPPPSAVPGGIYRPPPPGAGYPPPGSMPPQPIPAPPGMYPPGPGMQPPGPGMQPPGVYPQGPGMFPGGGVHPGPPSASPGLPPPGSGGALPHPEPVTTALEGLSIHGSGAHHGRHYKYPAGAAALSGGVSQTTPSPPPQPQPTPSTLPSQYPPAYTQGPPSAGAPGQPFPAAQGPAPAAASGAAGSSQRIDPSQIPSPTTINDRKIVKFNTAQSQLPPPSFAPFIVEDAGNASPKFIRLTHYIIPVTNDMQSASCIPFGAILQPLAQLAPDEEKVPVVDFGASGPVRCGRCRAYINPTALFVDGGRSWLCKMCDFSNQVPGEYFSPLTMSGRRQDIDSRPELTRGTVEFVATQDYISKERPPGPLNIVFVVDVSYISVTAGVLSAFTAAVKAALQNMPHKGAKIAIITYDTTIHFYSLKKSLQQPQMLVVPDIGSAFVPGVDGLLVDYQDSQPVVDALLDKLPSMFQATKTSEAAMAPALQAAASLLETTGGKVLIFQSSMPTYGPGALKKRDDPKLFATDKEKTLYANAEPLYKEIADKCATTKVSVDMFLFSSAFLDIASLSTVTKQTCGQVYYYPGFSLERHYSRFHQELYRNLTRPIGYDAVMRVRCSKGLSVGEYSGNFHMTNGTDMELSSVDSDKAFGITLKHDDALSDKHDAVLQAALLYTTADGQRRIRVHTVAVGCSTALANVFKAADLDAVVALLLRDAVEAARRRGTHAARTAAVDRAVAALHAYRKHCATASSPGQLILPESLKLLPIFTLAMLKSVLFRAGDVSVDERVAAFAEAETAGAGAALVALYPRLYALHTLSSSSSSSSGGDDDPAAVPPPLRLAADVLDTGGVYLLEDGRKAVVWVGRAASPSLLLNLFNVPSFEQLDAGKITQLEQLPNEMSTRANNLLNTLRWRRAAPLPLYVVKQKEPAELKFLAALVEDRQQDAMNYVDFLCHVHKLIQQKLS